MAQNGTLIDSSCMSVCPYVTSTLFWKYKNYTVINRKTHFLLLAAMEPLAMGESDSHMTDFFLFLWQVASIHDVTSMILLWLVCYKNFGKPHEDLIYPQNMPKPLKYQ